MDTDVSDEINQNRGDEMDREKVIKGLECHRIDNNHRINCADCPYYVDDDNHIRCVNDLHDDALALLKEQEKLVNVDKLREELGFAESCEKCKKDSWRCQRDTYFTEMDFCNRLDFAIEELTQEGR